MAALLPRRFAACLVLEADLNRMVAVAHLIANEQNRTRPDLQNGDGLQLAAFVINLRHSDFKAQKSQCHGKDPFQPLYEERSLRSVCSRATRTCSERTLAHIQTDIMQQPRGSS